MKVLRPQKLVLDPEATIEECEYTGEYVGEIRTDTAANLIKRFPKKEKLISDTVKDKLGTTINYGEWWTNDYLFWTLENKVLAKTKNPHWNYDTQTTTTDQNGNQLGFPVKGNNHFLSRKMPIVSCRYLISANTHLMIRYLSNRTFLTKI